MTDQVNDRYHREPALRKLRDAIITNRQKLDHMYADHSGSEVAWVARNLLELDIWTIYCAHSEECAKRFIGDGARDAFGMIDLPDDFLKPESIPTFQSERARLTKVAEQRGVSDLSGVFKRVAKAAKEMGVSHFEKKNMMLSKFAHPTALIVLYPESVNEVKDVCYKAGVLWAEEALRVANEFLRA